MPTYFNHEEIDAVLSDVVPFNNFMLNFFGAEHVTDDQQINFDKISPDNRLAVFVNPRKPGEVVKSRGFKVESYIPGYIKDKTIVDPKHVFTRRPGEAMGAPLSNAERYAATVVDLAAKQKERLYRTLELMACNFLLNGKYTMKGEEHLIDVDFVRNAGNSITLTGANRWLDANTSISPVDNLDTWINLAIQPIRQLVMGNLAFKQLKKDPKYDRLIYIDLMTRGKTGLEYGPKQQSMDGVTYRGTLQDSGIEIYTYSKTYTDNATGTETLYIPADAVIGVPDAQYGWQCFAAIWDEAANYSGMQYFFKNWAEQDPGVPVVMLQSAPLLAHTKINSTFGVLTGATGA